MKNFVRDKIIYIGISEYIPQNIDSFTNMSVHKSIIIDKDLPPIDEILKVSINSKIRDEKLVKTGIGNSLEGQILTGYKYLSEGEFFFRIDFCVDDFKGSIYTYSDSLFFNNATTLHESMNINSKIISNIYIEDIYAQKIDSKEILININFIFTVEN